VVLRVTLVLLAVRSSSTHTVAGVLTVEVPSPARISPRLTARQRTPHDGSVRTETSYACLVSYCAFTAKSLVAAGLARRALVQLSYAIGVAEPLSIYVDTYGTGKKTDEELVAIIRKNWDLRPGVIGMLHQRPTFSLLTRRLSYSPPIGPPKAYLP